MVAYEKEQIPKRHTRSSQTVNWLLHVDRSCVGLSPYCYHHCLEKAPIISLLTRTRTRTRVQTRRFGIPGLEYGKSMFYDEQWLTSSCLHLYTDACTRSFGAMFGDSWLCDTFDNVGIPNRRSITFKELFAITMAITVWATALVSQKIIFHCDNKAAAHILTSGTSKCRHINDSTTLSFLYLLQV